MAASRKASLEGDVEIMDELFTMMSNKVVELEKKRGLDRDQNQELIARISNLETQLQHLKARGSKS